MKKLAIYTFSIGLGLSAINPTSAIASTSIVSLIDYPAKTVVIKNPQAANVDQFFSTSKAVSFEVYKPGSQADINTIVSKLKANSTVESVSIGATTGDFVMINVILKTVKDKATWVNIFKSAGLNTIKINNNNVVAIEKM